ncbi:hypothetical protein GCM10027415_16780 [Humibacter ginsengisoli]
MPCSPGILPVHSVAIAAAVVVGDPLSSVDARVSRGPRKRACPERARSDWAPSPSTSTTTALATRGIGMVGLAPEMVDRQLVRTSARLVDDGNPAGSIEPTRPVWQTRADWDPSPPAACEYPVSARTRLHE